MLRKLKKTSLYHIRDGVRIEGPHSTLWGDCTGLWGDCTGLWGDCTDLRGDCTGLRGYCTWLDGDLDQCGLTDKDRKEGRNIETLIEEEEKL